MAAIREIPLSLEWKSLRKCLIEMREALLALQKTSAPPRPVTNFTATGKPLGVLIMFTRSDAESYIVYRSSTPELQAAVQFELHNTGVWTDELGSGALKRYYWVRAKRGGKESSIVGPVSATSLAAGAAFTPPAAPPAVDEYVQSTEYGYPVER
jgi:hypothetical protein